MRQATELGSDGPVNSPRAVDGTRCSEDRECRSGACVDHVCCDSRCTGLCLSCDKPGSEGQCLPITEGEDPGRECDEEPATTCGRDGACDGRGNCRRHKAGTECAPGSCSVATEHAASTCDGAGVCQAGNSKSCAPAVCIESSCGAPCAVHGDCQAGFFCDAGTCRIKRDQGAACAMDEQCAGGHCADKICCATACTDKCYACNVAGSAGTCTPVADMQDPKNDCPIQNIFTCGNAGGCNGKGGCRLHVPGTPCGFDTCTGSTVTGAGKCDGMGACKPGPKKDCTPFTCNGFACWTACSTAAQCKPGHACNVSKCQ